MLISAFAGLPRYTRALALFFVTFASLTLNIGKSSAGTDDYPASWSSPAQDSVVDNWGFYSRECTSFAAWRLHSRNGFEMPWAYGYANVWGTKAKTGYTVNNTPSVGAIAWWSSGHVAWVEAVNGSSVTIEEYNYDYHGHYHERSINAASASGYIHFKDVINTPPPPPATGLVPLYRYSNSLGHYDRFYTTNFGEIGNGGFGGWNYEGIQCRVYTSQAAGTVPFYRYANPYSGLHFYTVMNADLSRFGYHMEGVQCYVYDNSVCYVDPNIIPLYRYFNVRNGSHFYTTNRGELGGGNADWRDEGIECNVRR